VDERGIDHRQFSPTSVGRNIEMSFNLVRRTRCCLMAFNQWKGNSSRPSPIFCLVWNSLVWQVNLCWVRL